MDLVHQVAANLEIEAGKAEKGIGAILMALRMNLDGDTFNKVKHVLPNSESLMGRAHGRRAHRRDGGARRSRRVVGGARGRGLSKRRHPAPGAPGARAPAARYREGEARRVLANGTDAGIRTRDFALVSAAERRYA